MCAPASLRTPAWQAGMVSVFQGMEERKLLESNIAYS
jgi:hypothetical protein